MVISAWFKVVFSQQSDQGIRYKITNAREGVQLPEVPSAPREITAEAQ